MQTEKYKYAFLKSLIYYLVFFNLLILIGLSYQYILINLFDNSFDQIPLIILLVQFTIVVASEFGITYSIFRLVSNLKERPVSKVINTLLIIWVSIFGSATLIGIIIFIQESTYELLYVIHEVWILSMITIIPVFFIGLIIHTIKNQHWNKQKKKGVRILALYFLLCYLLFAISNLDFYFFQFNLDEYDPVLFLIMNLWPFLWIKLYFQKYHDNSLSKTNDDLSLVSCQL